MATPPRYLVGELVTVSGSFTDPVTSAAVDPDSVVVVYRDPTGVRTTPDVTRVSAGHYSVDIDTTNKPGNWSVYMYAPPGDGQAAAEYVFIVDASLTTP